MDADRHDEDLLAAQPSEPPELNDRAAEAWEPLLAIADLAGGPWPTHARSAAVQLSTDDDDDPAYGAQLLAGIRAMFDGHEVMSSADLAAALNEIEELPFGSWRDGRGIDPRTIARLLRPYRVRPNSVRVPGSGGTVKGYRREWFDEPFALAAPHPDRSGTSGTSGTRHRRTHSQPRGVRRCSGRSGYIQSQGAGPLERRTNQGGIRRSVARAR